MSGSSETKLIKLDAANWKNALDFYNALLLALGAPEWHGRNINALMDSMIWGEINDVEPPYKVQIYSTKNLPADVTQELKWVEESLAEQRAYCIATRGHDVQADFEIIK